MKIDLDQVVDEPYDWQEKLSLATGEVNRAEVLEIGEIACRGRITPLFPDFLFQASFGYRRRLRCMRCLGSIDERMESEISLVLQVDGREPDEEEVELTPEDLGVVSLSEPEVDTRPLLVEQIHLEVPMKPLCREDCAGLCPQCGADLNAGPCDCRPEVDPRWSALLSLKS
jgi:uncharacterized metal-binding protein YceD (DUF177 family)